MSLAHDVVQEGALIRGQFRLKRQLGEGGMGTVWEAEHLSLGGSVALKFLGHEHMHNESIKSRFVREARSASRIRSPHVVQVLDQGTTEDGIPYLVMELLEGEDLAKHLAREGRCSLADTALILDQIGRALSKAHREGLVHRDIKPHNIFLVPDGENQFFVKLLDFGIAKDAAQNTRVLTLSGAVLGSAHYISPEQLADPQSVGPATDIWALGVVVYEMLTGKVPFDGNSLPEIFMRVTEAKFTPVSELRPGLPSEIDVWLRKAIQPDRSLRFASVDEMSRAFARIARGHSSGVLEKSSQLSTPVLAPAGLPTPVSAGTTDVDVGDGAIPGRRRPWMVWAIVASALVVLGLLALLGIKSGRDEQADQPQVPHQVLPAPKPIGAEGSAMPAGSASSAVVPSGTSPPRTASQAPPPAAAASQAAHDPPRARASPPPKRPEIPDTPKGAVMNPKAQPAAPATKYRGF